MREILFRGKRIDNGEWVEGFYVMYSKSIAYPYSYTNGEHTIVTLPHNFKYEIEFETICQYTGLTDKNGNKIFEGDIVEYKDESLSNYEYHDNLIMNRGSIGYSDGTFYWTNAVATDLEDNVYGGVLDCKVIGNVFDNPELLEVRE